MIEPRASKPMVIHFIRHAISESNVRRGHFGDRDPPLISEGREQAMHLGNSLRRLGVRPDLWMSSELVRAKDTLDIIMTAMLANNEQTFTDARLNEIERGDWTNKAFEEVFVDKLVIEQFRDDYSFRPPNGESMQDVSGRISECFTDIVQTLNDSSGHEAVIVSHGRAIQALHQWFSACRTELGWRYTLDNTSVTTFEFHQRAGWGIARINARPHLGW